MDIKLPHLQKENQTLRDYHISKRSITQTVLNQNNELLKLVNFQQITEKGPLKENQILKKPKKNNNSNNSFGNNLDQF